MTATAPGVPLEANDPCGRIITKKLVGNIRELIPRFAVTKLGPVAGLSNKSKKHDYE